MKYFLSIASCMAILAGAGLCAAEDIGRPFAQLGHSSNDISTVVYSPDGKVIVSTAVYDPAIKFWDVDSGRVIKSFIAHANGVKTVIFSNDGNTIASAGQDGSIKFWDVGSGEVFQSENMHHSGLTSIAYSPDNQFIVSSADDEYEPVKIWDLRTGSAIDTPRPILDYARKVNCVVYSTDGKTIAMASDDGTVTIWDVRNGNVLQTLRGHKQAVLKVIYSSDGKTLISSSKDQTIKLWDSIRGKLIRTLSGHKDLVDEIALSPDGRQLISASKDKTIKIWDIKSGKLMKSIQVTPRLVDNSHSGRVLSLSFSPDGQTFVTGSSDKVIAIRQAPAGKIIKSMQGYAGTVDTASISHNGNTIVTGITILGTRARMFNIWDVTSGKTTKSIIEETMSRGLDAVFHPEGNFFATTAGSEIKLRNIANSNVLKTLSASNANIYKVAFSPDGKLLVSVNDNRDITLWDTATAKSIKNHSGYKIGGTGGMNLVFGPAGKTIAFGNSDEQIILMNVRTGKIINELPVRKDTLGYVSSLGSLAFSPDNKSIAAAYFNGDVFLSDARSGKTAITIKAHSDPIESIAFSVDGKQLITGSWDLTIKLWDVHTGKLIRTFAGHNNAVEHVEFTDNGKYILSGSRDGSAKLWDIKSGKELASFVNFSDGEWVVVTPNGYFNASENGAKYLNVRTGPLSVSDIDAYYEKFYRPDIVRLALSGKSINENIRLADLKPAPRVEFIKTQSKSKSDSLDVTLKITDLGGGIGDIRLYRNDTAVRLDGGRSLRREKKTDKVLIKNYIIKLEKGANELKAIAFDAKNWGRSEYATHLVTATIAEVKPALHAVIIGIENYRNQKLNLKYAVDDAELFSKSLKQNSTAIFSEVKVELLTTKEQTSKDAIIEKLQSLQNMSPQDLFVFYVASHGTIDDGTYYLVTSNVGSTSTKKLKEDAISQETLKQLISNIPTAKKMIILDTCNSQALGDSLQVAMLTRGMSEDTAVKVLSRAVGSTILSAATSAQEALEGYKGHGLFTYVLADGLRGEADANKDGFVKTNELADYIEDTVPDLAEKVFGRQQFPIPARNGQSYPVTKAR